MPKGRAWETRVIDKLLGQKADFAVPDELWVALYVTAPTSAGGGAEVSTVNTGYRRVRVPNDATMWPPAIEGTKANALPIAFAHAVGPWGAVVAFGLHLHETQDTLYLWGPLNEPIFLDMGDDPSFDPLDLSVEEV
jgi:hypothetical protein